MLPSTKEIELKVTGNLRIGHKYVFRLLFAVGDRAKVVEHIVDILTCDKCKPPTVVFFSKENIENPRSKILVEAQIQSSIEATYVWSNVRVDKKPLGQGMF